MVGVAAEKSTVDYNTEDFKLFHQSLIYVCDYEERLY
jgi:hypothetical protein